jgi:hypothetical protein
MAELLLVKEAEAGIRERLKLLERKKREQAEQRERLAEAADLFRVEEQAARVGRAQTNA